MVRTLASHASNGGSIPPGSAQDTFAPGVCRFARHPVTVLERVRFPSGALDYSENIRYTIVHTTRGGAARNARLVHIQEVIGSNPIPATNA